MQLQCQADGDGIGCSTKCFLSKGLWFGMCRRRLLHTGNEDVFSPHDDFRTHHRNFRPRLGRFFDRYVVMRDPAVKKVLPSLLSVFCVVMSCLVALSPPQRTASAEEGAAPITDRMKSAQQLQEKMTRLREGAEIVDATGTFEWMGDRLSFVPDNGKGVLKILENRMMERVVQAQETSTGELIWVVTGTVTEYRGSNFLMMKHVVLTGKRGD